MKEAFFEKIRNNTLMLNKGPDDSIAGQDDHIDVDMEDFVIPDSEERIVDSFLSKFTIISESSMNDHMDIVLMLKALPNKVIPYTLP